MNEKIKELAELAMDDLSGCWLIPDQFCEHFAQLIIAKCIEEAGDPADDLILDDTWPDGVRASVWSIKQYFGVDRLDEYNKGCDDTASRISVMIRKTFGVEE